MFGALALTGSAAQARPSPCIAPSMPAVQQAISGADRDPRLPPAVSQAGQPRLTTHGRNYRRRARVHARRAVIAAQSHANSAYGGASTNELVAEARKYIGTNPTGRRSLWCGAFMDMVLKETGHKGGGNLALGYRALRHSRRRPASRRHRGDGPPWRRPCRRRHRRRCRTAIRSSFPAITITRWPRRFIRAAVSRPMCCRPAERDADIKAASRIRARRGFSFLSVSSPCRPRRYRRQLSPRHRCRNRRDRNFHASVCGIARSRMPVSGSTSVAAQRTMRLTTLSRALAPIAISRPSRSNSCQAGQPAT